MKKIITVVISLWSGWAYSATDPRWPNQQEPNTYYNFEREELKNQKKEDEERRHELITQEQKLSLQQKNEQLFQANKHTVLDLEGKNQQ